MLETLQECGRWYLSIPWPLADAAYDRLKRQGCGATLCLDPGVREARLELWPGVDPERARLVLQDLLPTEPNHPTSKAG